MTDSSTAITVRGVTKTFHSALRRPGLLGGIRSLVIPKRVAKTVVKNVSFVAKSGELVALLGPNGAGKSTTIKMLAGILVPSAGEIKVAGLVPHQDRERNARNIGAVFGQRTQLWWDLPARQSLAILRDIFSIDEVTYRARLRELDDLLELSKFWDTRVRHLSLGQRVRCDLAAALLHDPPVVFLDEPTIGMDVVVKEQVRQFLRHQVDQRGRTVLLTTHDMAEVERLAERVVLINHGQIVLDGTLDQIRHRFGGTWQVHVTLVEPGIGIHLEGISVVRRDGSKVVLGPDRPSSRVTAHEVLKHILDHHEVTSAAIEESDLEGVMRTAYLDRSGGS